MLSYVPIQRRPVPFVRRLLPTRRKKKISPSGQVFAEVCRIAGWVVDIAEALGKETETAIDRVVRVIARA